VRIFSEGFFVDKIENITTLPIVVSIAKHVECVWTIDSNDVYNQAVNTQNKSSFNKKNTTQDNIQLGEVNVPSGLLIIFKLKNSESTVTDDGDNDNEDKNSNDDNNNDNNINNNNTNNYNNIIENPLELASPFLPSTIKKSQYLAIFVETGGRASKTMQLCLSTWRNAFRLYSIDEFKGNNNNNNNNNVGKNNNNNNSSYTDIPDEILMSFLLYIDVLSLKNINGEVVENNNNIYSNDNNNYNETMMNDFKKVDRNKKTVEKNVLIKNQDFLKPIVASNFEIFSNNLVNISNFFVENCVQHFYGLGYTPFRFFFLLLLLFLLLLHIYYYI
jgi:hypothetical protein